MGQVTLDDRGRRRALNEAAFRRINDRLVELNKALSEFTDRFSIVCECDRADCMAEIELRPEAYEAIRADARLFAVIAGHEAPDVEDVVAERVGFNVVRKKPGEPERIALSTDPRAGS